MVLLLNLKDTIGSQQIHIENNAIVAELVYAQA